MRAARDDINSHFWSMKMGKKLFVGNLNPDVTAGQLMSLFAAHGTVEAARIAVDADAGRSKGFGFVKMKTDEEAQAATTALNGKDSDGRALIVRAARSRSKEGRNPHRRGEQAAQEQPRLE
jgi:RNA recognition motif-containing protein